ncbi:MAG: glycosyltransferase family 2 protein [Sedimentisphaerales bacterium]
MKAPASQPIEHKMLSTVSVVIPLYNKGRHIERALNSALAQTHKPLEIIIVDDGSTDDGPERVRRCRNPELVLLTQDNKGPGSARNAGLSKARGKYIAFLDADDEWLPAFLETGISLLEDKSANVTVLWTGYLISPDMTMVTLGNQGLGRIYEIRPHTDISLVNNIMSSIWTCSAIMRTDIVKKWGGFFDQYKCLLGEDKYLFIKLLFNERLGIINEPLAIYHTEDSDLCSNRDNTRLKLEPFLEDPDDIINSCPLDTRHILRHHLFFWALTKAEMYAKFGRGKQATILLNRFTCSHFPYTKEEFRVRVLSTAAPILPLARRLWASVK